MQVGHQELIWKPLVRASQGSSSWLWGPFVLCCSPGLLLALSGLGCVLLVTNLSSCKQQPPAALQLLGESSRKSKAHQTPRHPCPRRNPSPTKSIFAFSASRGDRSLAGLCVVGKGHHNPHPQPQQPQHPLSCSSCVPADGICLSTSGRTWPVKEISRAQSLPWKGHRLSEQTEIEEKKGQDQAESRVKSRSFLYR